MKKRLIIKYPNPLYLQYAKSQTVPKETTKENEITEITKEKETIKKKVSKTATNIKKKTKILPDSRGKKRIITQTVIKESNVRLKTDGTPHKRRNHRNDRYTTKVVTRTRREIKNKQNIKNDRKRKKFKKKKR